MSFLAFHDIITDHFVRKYINENNQIINKQIEHVSSKYEERINQLEKRISDLESKLNSDYLNNNV